MGNDMPHQWRVRPLEEAAFLEWLARTRMLE
jgi:hypothetical protein